MASVTVDQVSSTFDPLSLMYTISGRATLDGAITGLVSMNTQAWVTFDGAEISQARANLTPTLDPKVWNASVPNCAAGEGEKVWLVAFIDPPDDSQPFSGSNFCTIPVTMKRPICPA
jgi:hypothetical protein